MKDVLLAQGVRLHYIDQGSSGLPVVLLPGLGDSSFSYTPVLEHMPGDIRAIALTLRGHGDSSKPAAGYGFDDFASDVAAFLDALDIARAVVAGHSMGCTIALRLALRDPARVAGLVLAGPPPCPEGKRDLIERLIVTIPDEVDLEFVRDFTASLIVRPVPQHFLDMVLSENLKTPGHVWRAVFEAILADTTPGRLAEIHAPAIVVWGAVDELCVRADQEALVASIQGARLVEYEDAGHLIHWEQPERFASDLVRFVRALM